MSETSSQELSLLTKLLAFYKKKYTGKEVEDKFNDAVEDLIETGDVSKTSYIKFSIDNEIEPRVKKVVQKKNLTSSKKSSSSSSYSDRSSSSSSGCGGGGSVRSSC
jgi:non-homologous end joining protein Ku